jgi:hypothetical protein
MQSMEYQRSFRVTYISRGVWSEKHEFRYFDDEEAAKAFITAAAAKMKVEDRPWMERVMLLKIEGDYYDVGGRCAHVQVVDRDGATATA